MKYLALFRGINVGGKNIVKMANLKQLFVDLGFANVVTYIQSGNVVFDSNDSKTDTRAKIQSAFVKAFGFESAIILRALDEMQSVVENLPFSDIEITEAIAANPDVEHLYIYYFDDAVNEEDVKLACEKYEGEDKLHVSGREIYLLFYQSIRDSKLAMSLGKLKAPVTVRNIKTTNKLLELMNK